MLIGHLRGAERGYSVAGTDSSRVHNCISAKKRTVAYCYKAVNYFSKRHAADGRSHERLHYDVLYCTVEHFAPNVHWNTIFTALRCYRRMTRMSWRIFLLNEYWNRATKTHIITRALKIMRLFIVWCVMKRRWKIRDMVFISQRQSITTRKLIIVEERMNAGCFGNKWSRIRYLRFECPASTYSDVHSCRWLPLKALSSDRSPFARFYLSL